MPHVQFHLYEMSRIGKPIETGNWLLFARAGVWRVELGRGIARGHGFLSHVMKMFSKCGDWLNIPGNILKIAEWYTLNGWLVWYVSYILLKLLYRKKKSCDQLFQQSRDCVKDSLLGQTSVRLLNLLPGPCVHFLVNAVLGSNTATAV